MNRNNLRVLRRGSLAFRKIGDDDGHMVWFLHATWCDTAILRCISEKSSYTGSRKYSNTRRNILGIHIILKSIWNSTNIIIRCSDLVTLSIKFQNVLYIYIIRVVRDILKLVMLWDLSIVWLYWQSFRSIWEFMYRNYKIFSARIYLADNSGKCLNHPLGELILIFSGIVVDSRRMLGYANIAVLRLLS